MRDGLFGDVLERLGLTDTNSGVYDGEWVARPSGGEIVSTNPASGREIARVLTASRADYDRVAERSQNAFRAWREVPAPRRGEVVRQLGLALREAKKDLGLLVTLETGKIRSEGEGEVQEMIDVCDFATGLSRQLYGRVIPSERPRHRMFEQWHPLGVVGVVTAFNFPAAVWAWNATIATVCGDTCVWKPSPRTPLTAVAVQKLVNRVFARNGFDAVCTLCVGDGIDVGTWMADDPRVPLVSATGSCAMGREVGERVSRRLGKTLLELGGNNAAIVTESADLDLALRSVVFAAVGTAGQRCTTLRRLILHESVADEFVARLARVYRSVRVGMPWEDGVLMGPLVSEAAVARMLKTVAAARDQGGEVLYGGRRLDRPGYFVEPTIIRGRADMPVVAEETFAPILYVMTYESLDDAIRVNNSVPQGLSSGIFTARTADTERFLSAVGSDCGIANVNAGTSGAEIGGAFGGEKDSGGGREAGSDSWKAYMRRQTCTVNWGGDRALAQGVEFDIPG